MGKKKPSASHDEEGYKHIKNKIITYGVMDSIQCISPHWDGLY